MEREEATNREPQWIHRMLCGKVGNLGQRKNKMRAEGMAPNWKKGMAHFAHLIMKIRKEKEGIAKKRMATSDGNWKKSWTAIFG
jgi:hypothetical protein